MKQYNPVTMEEVAPDGSPWYKKYLDEFIELNNQRNIDRLEQANDKDFLWLTHNGDFVYVRNMQTDHLFNAFRMLYNHGVPPAFRVGKFIRWNDVFNWSRDYKDQAFDAMKNELATRTLSEDQEYELEDIGANCRAFKILLEREDSANPMVGEPYNVD